jgi:hypothetical protein
MVCRPLEPLGKTLEKLVRCQYIISQLDQSNWRVIMMPFFGRDRKKKKSEYGRMSDFAGSHLEGDELEAEYQRQLQKKKEEEEKEKRRKQEEEEEREYQRKLREAVKNVGGNCWWDDDDDDDDNGGGGGSSGTGFGSGGFGW